MDQSNSKTPKWRPEGDSTSDATQGGPKWRQAGALPERRAFAAARALRIVGTLFLFAVACGALIWVSTWLQLPKRTSMVLIGAGYEDNLALAPNVYGWQGLSDLASQGKQRWSFLGRGRELLHVAVGPKRLQVDDDWTKGLATIDDTNLLLVLAMHGGADAEGPYLLPDNATTGTDPKNRLRLKSILDALAKQPASQKKLLVLDCVQIEANWELGMLTNEFSRQLAAMENEIAAIPNLIVVSSTAPDQRSWVSDEWRQSCFMHYLIDGLHGSADKNGDTQIDADELFDYTAERVERWAWSNRIALQTPMLLPRGLTGKQRASRIRLNITGNATAVKQPDSIPQYTPPDSLKEAWVHCQQLASSSPAPTINAPRLWRRYLDVLLRYDALVRAGADQAWGQVLLAQLDELEQGILSRRYVDLLSGQNTLSMPVLSGRSGSIDASIPAQFQNLWNADSKDYAAVWAKMNSNPAESTNLRMQCFDLLFRRASEASAANLAKACELARVIADPVNPMPVEIHTLLMYNRYMPGLLPSSVQATGVTSAPGQIAELAQKSLLLARQGDAASLADFGSTYAYSSWVAPWLRGLVDQGDANRLEAQDLLFVGDADSLQMAAAKMDAGKQLYHRAEQEGMILQKALATRDRILPMLPYYCRWCANLRSGLEVPATGQAQEPMIVLVESLCRDTYKLDENLAPPPPGQSPLGDGVASDGRLRDIEALADRVDAQFRDLLARFLEVWRQNADVNLPSLWRDAENALSVPYLDPEMRMALIEHSRRISRKFLIESAGSSRIIPSLSAAQNRQIVQARGAREGRMAIASLGQRWFNEAPGSNRENFQQVEYRLSTFAVEENWWQSLMAAGSQIAMRFNALGPEITSLVKKASTIGESDARFALARATQLARLLPGSISLDPTVTPLVNERKLLVTDALVWQAQRTLADHWYSEDPTISPYYRVAGLLYIDDAMIQAPDPWLHDKISKTSAQLTQSGAVTFAGPASLALTSEQGFSLEYTLQAAEGAYVPSGYPAVWVSAGANLDLQFPAAGTRIRRELDPSKNASSVTCSLTSPLVSGYETSPVAAPSTATSTVTANAFYRGQPVTLATSVRLDTVPTIVVRQLAPPSQASIAVQAAPGIENQYGASQGAVTFVLDASGSMGPPVGQAFDSTTKFAEATAALQGILAKVPRGTMVSLWVFGEAVGPDKTVADPSQSVRQVIPPTYWDPTNPSQLTQLMSQISYPTVEPWNQSPIVRAMLYAKNDLTGASGPTTLIVISDGMDNCFANDTQLNPKGRSIPTALTEAFGQSAIEILFIGYKLADAEQQRAEDQFKVITGFQVPGQFLTVDQGADIVENVTGALRKSMRYRIETLANTPAPGLPPAGLEISPNNASAQWYPGGLPAGAYNLMLSGDDWVEKTMLLNRGDLLLTEVVQGPSGVAFQRGAYAANSYPWRPYRQVTDWRLSILQNQSLKPNGLEMLLTLERSPDPNATLLTLQRPRETWLEVAPPAEITTPFTQVWSLEYGYPAPAWSLRVPSWPVSPVGQTPAPPTVRAWWSPDQSAQPASILRQGADFRSYSDIRNRSLSIEGSEVIVDSVRVEEHTVETAPGKREKVSCLVIRFSKNLPADVPPDTDPTILRVRVGGITTSGWEERYYTSSHAQAMLYWPVGADEAEQLTEVSVYSLASFKDNATRRGFHIDLNTIGVPSPNDARPQKPVNLR